MITADPRLLQDIINILTEPVIVVSRDYQIEFINEAGRNLCSQGDCSATAPGLCYQVVQGRANHCDQYGDECPVKTVFKSGRKYKTLSKKFPSPGNEKLFEVEAVPIFNKAGEVEKVVEIFRQVTNASLVKDQKELKTRHEELKRIFKLVERAKREWESAVDCLEDPVIIADFDEKINRFNLPLLTLLGDEHFQNLLGRHWKDILTGKGFREAGFFGDELEFHHAKTNRSFTVKVSGIKDKDGSMNGSVITLHDISERKQFINKLEQAYRKLKSTHSQMLQQEKMASIGQLAAGVAHEINNPIGFVSSNLVSLGKYADNLHDYIHQFNVKIKSNIDDEPLKHIEELRKKFKIDFIIEDLHDLVKESTEGIDRVRKIVQNLKNFSRIDQAECKASDLNECLDATISILNNEIGQKAALKKNFRPLPLINCYPHELNQVFMNILLNAFQAIEKSGVITIKTWHDHEYIYVRIADTGCGIKKDDLPRIFEPFFTTRDVGKGAGLGLSIAYDIITKKHNGDLVVESVLGKGSAFTIKIPIVEDNHVATG